MERHFLIAVSEQKSALLGVRFVGTFFSDKQEVKSTLFYSAPKPPELWEDEKNIETSVEQQRQKERILTKGKSAIETAAKEAIEWGFVPDNLIPKLQSQMFTKVADIIHEGEKGRYDAVVLGRRGLSMIEEAFDSSVSRGLFNERFTFPLWLCRSVDPERKNVLLYVDGSQTSFRMVDHTGFVTGLENRHRLDIMISDQCEDPSQVMEKCRSILSSHEIADSSIVDKGILSGNVAKALMKNMENENYAVLALGRQCSEKSNLFTRLFKGPVCSILFKELENAALWVCH